MNRFLSIIYIFTEGILFKGNVLGKLKFSIFHDSVQYLKENVYEHVCPGL